MIDEQSARFIEPGVHLRLSTIAIDVTPILPGGENGGAKLFVLELIRGLSRMAPQIDFILLTHSVSHDELASLDCKNVRRMMAIGASDSLVRRSLARRGYSNLVSRLPVSFRRRLTQAIYKARGLLRQYSRRQILQEIGANLLFCPFTAPTFFDKSVPTVCTIYDLQFASYPEFFEPEDLAHRKGIFLDACKKASTLVAISNYSRDSAIAYGKLPPAQIVTIALRMARRISTTKLGASDILERLGLFPKRYILYPANFWKHKNHEMLLTAFGMACVQGLPNDIKLVCTGAPSMRKDYIQDAVTTIGLVHRVSFPGYVSNADLSTLLNNAVGLIFPSLYEGFGLPVIEAMAAGVPVACSNVTSLPEVGGHAALSFDPKKPTDVAQAIIDLVTDLSIRQQLIANGYQQAECYLDTDKMVSEYLSIFEKKLSKNKKHHDKKSIE